jgi:Ca2+-transporting ATPase
MVFLGCSWAIAHGIAGAELRTFAFAALVCGNLAMIHATRSRDRLIVEAARSANPVSWWITGAALAALIAAIYVRPVARVFGFAALSASWLAISAVAGVIGIAWYELYKLARRRGVARAR